MKGVEPQLLNTFLATGKMEGGKNGKGDGVKTRPDTRPPVADGWAGVDMCVFPLFDSC